MENCLCRGVSVPFLATKTGEVFERRGGAGMRRERERKLVRSCRFFSRRRSSPVVHLSSLHFTTLLVCYDDMMQATRHYDSAASSRATSPSLPLLSGFPVAEWDNSPSLPYSRQEKRQRHCAPAPRTLLPLAVAALFFPALLYLLLANPASTSSYLDRLRVSVALGPNQGGGKLWSLMHAPPAQALDEGGFVVVDATAEHTVTAIVLHGLSGSAWDWPFAQTLAQRYPYVKWLVLPLFRSPRALLLSR